MGYTTDFEGCFTFDRPLAIEHANYLWAFSGTRRMQRNPELTATLPDPIRIAVGLPVGSEGAYFVGVSARDDFGQRQTPDVVGYNEPPDGQPSLWCQWIPNEERTALVWDGNEKFYEYEAWLEYLIVNFFQPWQYVLNGTVEWQGEEPEDRGRLILENNKLRVQIASGDFVDRP